VIRMPPCWCAGQTTGVSSEGPSAPKLLLPDSSEEDEPLAVEPAAGGESANEQVGAEGYEWGATELPLPTAPEPARPPSDAPGTPSVSFRNASGHVDLIALQRSSANAMEAFWAYFHVLARMCMGNAAC